jgi:hypothetical protein
MSHNEISVEQADKQLKEAARIYLDLYDSESLKIEINLSKNKEKCKVHITDYKNI